MARSRRTKFDREHPRKKDGEFKHKEHQHRKRRR